MSAEINRDADHLRLLSIFHYIYAALSVLCMLPGLFVMLFFFPIAMMIGVEEGEIPGAVATLIAGGTTVFVLILFGFSFLIAGITAYAGKCLADRKFYTFCIIVAAISLLSFPFGTALGIFTLLVLVRPSVRALFDHPSRA